MEEYDFYFFDLFHTLAEIKPHEIENEREYKILNITQNEWNQNAEYEYNSRANGSIKNPKEIVERIVKNLDNTATPEKIKAIFNTRKQKFQKALVEIDQDILTAIKTLHKRNKKISLISNADEFDKLFWKESPLFPYFTQSIFSCDVGVMKPNIEIYKIAIQRINANTQRSVFIGDGGHNELFGAKKVGIDAILSTQIINKMWPEKVEILSINADFIINNLCDLLEY
jgi:putative hydrolase of the HAD superfamily